MAPKMGQPMEFLREVFWFLRNEWQYSFSGNPQSLFSLRKLALSTQIFEGVSLPGVEYLPVLTGLFLPLVLPFMISISEALSTEIKT